MSGGGYTGASTETEPWGPQQDYLTDIFQQGQKMYKNQVDDDWKKYGKAKTPYGFGMEGTWQVGNNMKDQMGTNFIENAVTGNLGREKRPTLAEFTDPQRAAQEAIYDSDPDIAGPGVAQTMLNSLTQDNLYANLVPEAMATTQGITTGGINITRPSIKPAELGAYRSFSPQTVDDVSNIEKQSIGRADFSSPIIGSPQDVSGQVVTAPTSQKTDYSYPYWNNLGEMAQGELAGENPYLDDMYSRARDRLREEYSQELLPDWDAAAAEAGRYGSGAWETGRGNLQEDYLDALGDMSAQLYGQAYESDMDRMTQALGLGGDLAQAQDALEAQRAMQQAQMEKDVGIRGVELDLEAQRANQQAELQTMLEQGQVDLDTYKTLSELNMRGDTREAELAQEVAMAEYQGDLQDAMQEAAFAQEAERIMTEQSLQEAMAEAQMAQEAEITEDQLLMEMERQNIANQMEMAQVAPDLAARVYDPIEAMAGVGEEQYNWRQAAIDAAVAQNEFLENVGTQNLGTYSQLLGGNWGGSSVTDYEGGK